MSANNRQYVVCKYYTPTIGYRFSIVRCNRIEKRELSANLADKLGSIVAVCDTRRKADKRRIELAHDNAMRENWERYTPDVNGELSYTRHIEGN